MTVLRHPNNAGVTLQQWRKTASGGETSLSGTDDFSASLSYTVGAEEVFINGVLIERGVDYTATSGTSISLTNALVAGDLATVQSATSFNVANAIPKATVTAKGDVIVGTGASTVTNLPVGADGTTLVANSSASTGVSWSGPSFLAGRNKILNGDFGIWQRGTSFSLTGTGYTADRWFGISYLDTTVFSQQALTAGSAPVAGYNGTYCLQMSWSSTTSGYPTIEQRIEDVRTLAGQTATLSFWIKANSALTGYSSINQNFGTGGSSTVGVTGALAISITTSWQRISLTVTMPSISGKTIGTNSFVEVVPVYVNPSTTANTIQIWGVQLEAGSVATPFTTATGTLQGELAACQRYYFREVSDATATYADMSSIQFAATTSQAEGPRQLPVVMRTAPTTLDYSNLALRSASGTIASVPTLTITASTTTNAVAHIQCSGVSGLTANQIYYLIANNSSSAYLGFGAEL